MCPPQALRRPQTQAACLPNIQEKKKKAEAHGIHTGCGQGEFIWILDQQSQRPVGVRDLRTEKKNSLLPGQKSSSHGKKEHTRQHGVWGRGEGGRERKIRKSISSTDFVYFSRDAWFMQYSALRTTLTVTVTINSTLHQAKHNVTTQ